MKRAMHARGLSRAYLIGTDSCDLRLVENQDVFNIVLLIRFTGASLGHENFRLYELTALSEFAANPAN